MDYEKILIDSITSRHYFSNKDLRLNKNYCYLLNNSQLNEYLKFKGNLLACNTLGPFLSKKKEKAF